MVSLTQLQFRIGAVIRQSLAVLRDNIVPIGVLYLLVSAPSSIYSLTLAGSVDADSNPAVRLLEFFEAFLGIVVSAAVTYSTVQYLRGRRIGFGEFFGRGLALGGAAIRVAILSGLGILAGLIALLVPGLVLYAMWWVGVPVAVVERPGAVASLRRSSELTKGFRWQIFGLMVGFLLAVLVAALLMGATIGAGVGLFAEGDMILFDWVLTGAIWVWTACFMAIQAVLIAVGYYHLRLAKEGIGIGDIAAVFD